MYYVCVHIYCTVLGAHEDSQRVRTDPAGYGTEFEFLPFSESSVEGYILYVAFTLINIPLFYVPCMDVWLRKNTAWIGKLSWIYSS